MNSYIFLSKYPTSGWCFLGKVRQEQQKQIEEELGQRRWIKNRGTAVDWGLAPDIRHRSDCGVFFRLKSALRLTGVQLLHQTPGRSRVKI